MTDERREDPVAREVLGNEYMTIRDISDNARTRAHRNATSDGRLALKLGSTNYVLPVLLAAYLGGVDAVCDFLAAMLPKMDGCEGVTKEQARLLAHLVAQKQLHASLARDSEAGSEEFRAALKKHGLDHIPIVMAGY